MIRGNNVFEVRYRPQVLSDFQGDSLFGGLVGGQDSCVLHRIYSMIQYHYFEFSFVLNYEINGFTSLDAKKPL